MYQILSAEQIADSIVVLDIGDATTVRGYDNVDDTDAGFVYDVAVGQTARIPLTKEWLR
ncbi:hypothetical protein [Phytoactinopolyspora limicola]|uniref:hypothetical protein n=1 Tax=Phytoactinopolyspora limicola TaxID=2715536 RepID=UPI00140B1D77|nr:hypothetical protein [Phytoactinopolyspora limicola]